MVQLGKAKEILKEGTVIILDITNTLIKTGDYLFYRFNDRFEKTEILSIQKDNIPVPSIENGEIGIQLD